MTPRKPIRTVLTVLRHKEPVGADAWRLTLSDPDDWELPHFVPGSHIDVHLPTGMVRTYSLCGAASDTHHYVLGIKREPEGRGGSLYLCDVLQPGDTLGVSLPRGDLALPEHTRHCIMVAGGIGVTPFLSLIPALAADPSLDWTLHMIYAGACPFGEELRRLDAGRGRVILHDTRRHGRPCVRQLVGAPRDHVFVACCGPIGLTSAFEHATADWPADQAHIERFVAPLPSVPADARPYRLVLAKSGRSVQAQAGETVLHALKTLDVDVDTSCESGICGACKVHWLSGQPIHRDLVLSEAERQQTLLACVATADGGELVVDL